ncbi:MAG: ABC transporter permease subunit [Alphaproteobacteria bacterium]
MCTRKDFDQAIIIAKRELFSYFSMPLAWIFTVIFLLLLGGFTFYFGQFFEQGQADLTPFFMYHPWAYMVFIPALSMRLWAEERRLGTIEFLLTQPIKTEAVVLGKFLAGWGFILVPLALTLPIWITVNVLGDPDNGVIVAGYFASFLLAGAYLAVSLFISACTKNQVVAFILSIVACFMFTLSDSALVLDLFAIFPDFVTDMILSLSFFEHFRMMSKGVIGFSDLIYFFSLIGLFLYFNLIVIEKKKAV